PQGAISATFSVTTHIVSETATVLLSAACNGGEREAALEVTPGGLIALTLAPDRLAAGDTATATVKLSDAAPAGGIAIPLSINDPAHGSVPASVTVPAGARTATFPVRTWWSGYAQA